MKLRSKRGFTLIELLVVVVIIAVLAAVAVPQYNKAVKKAQGREVLVAIDTLDKALHEYYLSEGSYGGSSGRSAKAENLSIQIPDLHYFTYYNPYDGASFHFQAGCGYSDTAWITIKNVKNPGLNISLVWEKGKLVSASCERSLDCAQYFNCPFPSLQASSIEIAEKIADYSCNLLEKHN